MNTRFHLIVKNECEFQWHHIFSVFPSFYSHKLVYISIMWIMRNQSFHYSKKKYIVSCLAKTKAYFSISNFPPCYNTGFVNFEGKKYCSYKHPPTFFFLLHTPTSWNTLVSSIGHTFFKRRSRYVWNWKNLLVFSDCNLNPSVF